MNLVEVSEKFVCIGTVIQRKSENFVFLIRYFYSNVTFHFLTKILIMFKSFLYYILYSGFVLIIESTPISLSSYYINYLSCTFLVTLIIQIGYPGETLIIHIFNRI